MSSLTSLVIGHILSDFVRDDALPFRHDDPRVRQAAAMTCCRLLSRDPICYQTSTHSIEIMSGVMSVLLTMGVADPGEFGVICIEHWVLILTQSRACERQCSHRYMNDSINISHKQRT